MYLTDKGRWVDICRPELIGHDFSLSQSQQLLLPLRFATTRRVRKREERDQRGTRPPLDRLTFFIHPMFTLVFSLFIQCSLLTLRFFGLEDDRFFLSSCPFRLAESSVGHIPPCLWCLHNFGMFENARALCIMAGELPQFHMFPWKYFLFC